MTQIVNLIIDELVEYLNEEMAVKVATDDPTHVDMVKKGKFQSDPTRQNIWLAVSGHDPEKPELADGLISSFDKVTDIGINFHTREIGGGVMWWRRGVIQVGCYFVRERYTEEQAYVHAYNVLGKVESLIESTPIRGLVDDFGEKAILIFCNQDTFFESGGPPKSYIFRGKVIWQVLTEKP
jgi:hypothetical protein